MREDVGGISSNGEGWREGEGNIQKVLEQGTRHGGYTPPPKTLLSQLDKDTRIDEVYGRGDERKMVVHIER